MKVRVAAYKLLLEVARAHRGMGHAEIDQLKRYRRALGVTKVQILRQTLTPITDRMIEGSEREREETVRAMVRVAFADGRMSTSEREQITEVAERIGVGAIQVANYECEFDGADPSFSSPAGLGISAPSSRRYLTMALGIAAVSLFMFLRSPRSEAREPTLQSHAEDLDGALVLLGTRYTLRRGGDTESFENSGTGFFTSPDGQLLTNKHVVEPWKFGANQVRLLEQGYTLDLESVKYSAWPIGSRVKGEGGVIVTDEAYTSGSGTLGLESTCPDKWVRGNRACSDGSRHRGRYHAMGNHDLAVLRASVKSDVVFIPLATGKTPLRVLDQIVVLGFPRGRRLLEGDRAISSPVAGTIRKVEEAILLSAPIFPGNSGGPVINRRGEAIGVAARRAMGEPNLGSCIPIEHARTLLGVR